MDQIEHSNITGWNTVTGLLFSTASWMKMEELYTVTFPILFCKYVSMLTKVTHHQGEQALTSGCTLSRFLIQRRNSLLYMITCKNRRINKYYYYYYYLIGQIDSFKKSLWVLCNEVMTLKHKYFILFQRCDTPAVTIQLCHSSQ